MTDLIWSEGEIRRFYRTVFPELRNDEVLITYLAARKKYGGVTRSVELLG
jgi:hypothetical protein